MSRPAPRVRIGFCVGLCMLSVACGAGEQASAPAGDGTHQELVSLFEMSYLALLFF